MPITLRCPACAAGMKVKEEVAGRKIKCPKCAHVFVATSAEMAVAPAPAPAARQPARTAEAPASSPTPRARPRAAAAPPPPPARDADDGESPASLDDLDVPVNFREKVAQEVGDESIVWIGRPDPNVMLKKAKIAVIVGSVMMLLGVAIAAFAFIGLEGIMMAVGAFFSLVFLLAGIGLILAPVWIKKFVNLRAVYVLTKARAVIVQKKLAKFDVRSFGPNQLQQTELQVRKDGSGSIVMKYDLMEHSKTSYKGISGGAGGKGQRKSRQGHVVEAEATTSTVRIPIPVGFLDILEVESVDRLFRASLRLPPPVERAPEELV